MKKILLIGFLLIILVTIPVLIYFLIPKQTNTRSKAAKSTTLSFSTLSAPVAPGQKFNLDVTLDPGTNQVSFVKLIISYNSDQLQRGSPGINPNTNVFPVTLEGPTYDQCTGSTCTMSITLSIGTELTKAIQGGAPATIASVNFVAKQPPADGSPTVVNFGNGTQVLSLASADQPSENVLATANPGSITIAAPSGTPSVSPSDTPVPGTPTDTPVPGAPTNTPGPGTPTNTPVPGAPTNTPGPGTPTATANQNPICTSLTADNTSTASAPLSVLFTANGNDPDGTVSKVTFNFGDGIVQDITSAGGIGTNTVNAQVSHTFQSSGIFTATATLTDDAGGISNPTSCSQTISIGAATITPSTTPSVTTQPTGLLTGVATGGLPSTGPGQTLMGIGIAGTVITILGGLFFFLL